MTTTHPKSKKVKVDLDDLALEVWEHYRNYLDSCENNENEEEGIGDIDELHEILRLATPHISKQITEIDNTEAAAIKNNDKDVESITEIVVNCDNVSSLLPVLISVTYNQLADIAIANDLQNDEETGIKQQNNDRRKDSDDNDENRNTDPQYLLVQSLLYYPHNAATWSMGANYGRMSKRMSIATVLEWYERAVLYSTTLREVAISRLDDEAEEMDGKENPNEEKDDVTSSEKDNDQQALSSSSPAMVKEWIELLYLHEIVGVQLEGDDDDESSTEDCDGKDETENLQEDEGEKKEDEPRSKKNKLINNDKDMKQKDYNGEQTGLNNSEEEEEEESTFFSSSLVEGTSRFMCSMLWSTKGRHDLAVTHLKHFPLTHRLHPNIWTMAGTSTDSNNKKTLSPVAFRPEKGILPSHLYKALLEVFAPDAAYWKESDYSNRGYYSYFMDVCPSLLLNDSKNTDNTTTNGNENASRKKYKPSNLIEEVIFYHLLPRAQQVLESSQSQVDDNCTSHVDKNSNKKSTNNKTENICGVEWWVHTRPIEANLGHNLHFDTDEALLAEEGMITHPILSSVLYLTGSKKTDKGADETDTRSGTGAPAGATIVFDQTPDSEKVAEKCWKSIPQDNSYMLFPGNMLHGVLPCPGTNKLDENTKTVNALSTSSLVHKWDGCNGERKDQSIDHRLTFMVGFWTRNVPEKMKNRNLYGPCGPLPPKNDEHTWVQEIDQGYEENNSETTKNTIMSLAKNELPVTNIPYVAPAWESIEANKTRSNSSIEDDRQELQIPCAIDHRFFVNGAPHCFRRSLFEDK